MDINVGFDTIGNATLICYDGGRPVLVTDPWIEGAPYFGSWTFSHEIPPPQLDAIASSEHAWFSHGHPDHLIKDSLQHFKSTKILLPDHVGGLIYEGMKERGYDAHILKDKDWVRLSDHIRVCCVCDYNQDATLLVDLNGRLLVNMNDGKARGWTGFVKRTVKRYPTAFYLHLYGGEADMRNFFDEQGNRLPLPTREQKLGQTIAYDTELLGASHFIPFSSFHKLQRADSVWLNSHLCGPEAFADGFESKTAKILPAFIRYDCERDRFEELHPAELPDQVIDPKAFGDDWSDRLEAGDVKKAREYFTAIAKLHDFLDFVRLRVGGEEHVIELAKRRFQRGITFEAPRHSLISAIDWEVFDDLLIGNYMKTTLHGEWPQPYPLQHQFTPYVAKYADNGRAKSAEEIRAYFRAYEQRKDVADVMDQFQERIERYSKNFFRAYVPRDSRFYRFSKRMYRSLQGRT